MARSDEFTNDYTGEVMTPAEYAGAMREGERSIFRLDRTIDDLKSSLKSAREDRDKAIAALRALARDSRYAARRPRVVRMKKGVQTSAQESKTK